MSRTIEEILNGILKAIYGREVRQDIHDGIEMGYNIATESKTAAQQAVSDAEAAILTANTAAEAANSAASSANTAVSAANNAADAANTAAQNAQQLTSQLTSQFQAWFDGIKDQLSTDAAGNLQNQIDDIKGQLGDALYAADTAPEDTGTSSGQ